MQRETISTKDAAQLIGCNQQSLREHIRIGIWKFGERIPKEKTGKKNDYYVIYRRKLYKHLGISGEEDSDAETT